ncbi:MAG TPA: hemerythrin domain-containing protein [Pseudomonadales bacterium]|jgi:hemerythrin superfamily protein
MTHITDTLHQDHQKVSQLIGELKETGGGAPATRASLCRQIRHELMAHSEFEEEVFYPALREGSPEGGPEVEAAFEEHEEVEQMLDEIEQMEPASNEFMTAIGRLERAVLEHVQHEESRIFPIAQQLLNEADADQMSREHDQMVQEHMQRAGV